MSEIGEPGDRLREAEAALAEAAQLLRSEAVAALPAWVQRCVATAVARSGGGAAEPVDPPAVADVEALGRAVAAEVDRRLGELLALDPDDQQATPLQVIRLAEPSVTALLAAAGVPAPPRDRMAEEQHPHDAYDLAVASLADLSEAAHEAGIRWGVARAMVHRLRHQG